MCLNAGNKHDVHGDEHRRPMSGLRPDQPKPRLLAFKLGPFRDDADEADSSRPPT
jgi:hypothetical protein